MTSKAGKHLDDAMIEKTFYERKIISSSNSSRTVVSTSSITITEIDLLCISVYAITHECFEASPNTASNDSELKEGTGKVTGALRERQILNKN